MENTACAKNKQRQISTAAVFFVQQISAHLSQVEFEYVADIMGIKVGELHQVLSILKRLAQLLHPRLGTIHAVDTLHGTETKCIQHMRIRCNFSGSPW